MSAIFLASQASANFEERMKAYGIMKYGDILYAEKPDKTIFNDNGDPVSHGVMYHVLLTLEHTRAMEDDAGLQAQYPLPFFWGFYICILGMAPDDDNKSGWSNYAFCD